MLCLYVTCMFQECVTCMSEFPAGQIQSLSCCQCKVCLECLKQHFTVVVREKYVSDLTCPYCQNPDISNPEEFGQHLLFLQLIVSAE